MTGSSARSEGETAWERLRRRKAVQWGIAYAAAAWVFLQVLEYVAESFDWPASIRRFALIALLLGLPIVIVMAWYHGDRGVQRVSRTELGILTLLFLSAGTFLWLYYDADEDSLPVNVSGEAGTIAPPMASPRVPRLAVMPLDNLSPDPADAYFADGLHDEILGALATSPDLQVISRTTMRAYRDVRKTVRQIAAEIGASHVLEGSVRRSGTRVRLLVQLIDATDDRPMWSESFDRNIEDALSLQQEIAAEVATTLNLRTSSSAASYPTTSNPEAYDLYLKARILDERNDFSHASMEEVEELCSRAIGIDPNYSAAYTLRAISRLRRLWFFADLSEDEWRSIPTDIDSANRLSPDGAHVLRARAMRHYYADMDYRDALGAAREGQRTYPYDADLREIEGLVLRRLGDFDAAVAAFRNLIGSEPTNAPYAYLLAETLRMSLQYTEASAAAHAYLERASPDALVTWEELLSQAFRDSDASALMLYPDEHAGKTDADSLWSLRTQALRLYGDEPALAEHLVNSTAEWIPDNGGFVTPVALHTGFGRLLLGESGAPAEAREILEHAANVSRFPAREYNFAFLEAGAALLAGDLQRARERALRAERLMPASRDWILAGQVSIDCAVILAWAGARQEAVDLLRRSLDTPNGVTPLQLRNDPLLTKPLSGYEGYDALKANLPERWGT